MEFRPLPEDRENQFQEYTHYAFSLQNGPIDEYDEDLADETGDPWALFDGGRMYCVCKQHWLRARLRDEWFEIPGLGAVASPPEHRRKGYVTRLLAESLAEYRDRGDFLTVLWAFEHPFYERQGWGLANKYVQYECDPEALSFARDHVTYEYASGEFHRVTADEYDRLEPVLAAEMAGYELALDRTERWWRKRMFEGPQGEPYVYAWEKDGEIRGYVFFRVTAEDDGKRLHAKELAAVDHEARLNCLRLLANHDSQVDRVSIYGPHETSLLDLTDDPDEIDCEVEGGPMARIVDVPMAFEAFDYPEAPDAEFTIAVADPLADWNDRTFCVAVEDGDATCEPADREAVSDRVAPTESDVTTDVATLSQVCVGYHSVRDAERLGDLEIENATAREILTAMFPERDVFLRDVF